MIIKNVRPFINGKIQDTTNIHIKGNKIVNISKDIDTSLNDEIIDMNNQICSAGFIDIHTHGGYGHDVMEGTTEALEAIGKFHLDHGTTTYIPTTLTADLPTTLQAIDNVRSFHSQSTARTYGVHLEGPFISLKAPGAHPPRYILEPTDINTSWVFDNADTVSRITVAPDQFNADNFTAECVKSCIQVSAGHDASIDDEIYAMVDNGCDSVTHMYNCTSRCSRRTTPHKHLGLTEVGLIEDKLICEVIADNRHVPNPLFKMIFKLKGADGIALVSDSLAIAGYKNGVMYLGSGEGKQSIVVQDGVAVIPELNTYAGSITPISLAVKNLVNNAGISLQDALTMATLTPAKLMKISDRGDIKCGYLADLVILNDQAEVIATVFDGKLLKNND